MLVQTQQHFYTLEEYRQLETTAEFRSEYRDGKIVKMPGGTINHTRITRNICTLLQVALRGKDAEPFMSDLRLWIPQYRRGIYPDIMVICGQPRFNEGRNDEVLNPTLIMEFLSPSTKDFDRENKFRFYRSISEFREYILVNQYEFLVEQYLKNESKQWLFQDYQGESATISLSSLEIQISMKDIYESVIFDTQATEEGKSK